MGLDTVEIVMKMEETFGIVFDDLDAEKIGTVGQAYRYILSKLELSPTAPCQSALIFYRLRRALMARTGADRRSIRPASSLADFLPVADRREGWVKLGNELGVTLPGLMLKPGLALLAHAFSLAAVAVWVACFLRLGGFSALSFIGLIFVTLVVGLGSLILILSALRPFANEFPPSCKTIGGTVLASLERQPQTVDGVTKVWHPDEVWAVLRKLVSEQAGVSMDRIADETSFVSDLGMD
jgi:acyl carrier protein